MSASLPQLQRKKHVSPNLNFSLGKQENSKSNAPEKSPARKDVEKSESYSNRE